ncbi:hypothetical protein ARMGADRAFT_320931 [Armillaria gallica]|uniref:Uncharacterized protein n=1 Tax=Armillaria gallica TaxID=47427 RepID=A0A2H3DR36_ARMGA|nr:hypothetical protein ARMGADRAFT_320931 [Armillaria gallica]
MYLPPRYLRPRDLFNHTVEFAFQYRLRGPPHGCTRRRIPFRIGSVGQLHTRMSCSIRLKRVPSLTPASDDFVNISRRVFTHISHMHPLVPSAQIDPVK